jgi:CheY-like chemotaxis protein
MVLSSVPLSELGAGVEALQLDGFMLKPVRQAGLREMLRALERVPQQGEAPGKDALAGPQAAALRRLRILVAEDNPVNQRVAVAMLERLGQRVEVAGNGQEAVEAVKRFAYDLVLMDVQMPELDGYEATRLIRALPERAGRLPIIAMTANALKGDAQKCLAAGMDDYLAKPVSTDALTAMLLKWAGQETRTPGGHASIE